MKINAIYCDNCKEIIYSRSNAHDYRKCSCGNIAVDGGFEYFKWNAKDSNHLVLKLRGNKLLSQILNYDYRFGNRNISDEYLDGWHGKFKIVRDSNEQFYKELIKNWDEFKPYFDKIKKGDR